MVDSTGAGMCDPKVTKTTAIGSYNVPNTSIHPNVARGTVAKTTCFIIVA